MFSVWQIAQRDYKFGKGGQKSLTKATYDAVGNLFRKLWGEEAGWAHSVLFTADLRAFSDRLAASKAEVKVKEKDGIKQETEVTFTATLKRSVSDREVKVEETNAEVAQTTATTSRRASKRLKPHGS